MIRMRGFGALWIAQFDARVRERASLLIDNPSLALPDRRPHHFNAFADRAHVERGIDLVPGSSIFKAHVIHAKEIETR
jgi:hypothetical protein